jgi:hypothetical protein
MRRTDRSDDIAFYGAYGGVFVSLGIWLVLWAMEIITAVSASLLWLMTIGLIVIFASSVKPAGQRKSARYPNPGFMFGFILIILSVSLLGVVYKVINGFAALGIIIAFCGLGILIYGLITKR